jgi:hypothetical protein
MEKLARDASQPNLAFALAEETTVAGAPILEDTVGGVSSPLPRQSARSTSTCGP